MASCSVCHDEISLLTNTNKCIENAFENIRRHYQVLRNIILEKDCKIEALQLRNEKLGKAVQLLQQRQQTLEHSDKRRKIACPTSGRSDATHTVFDLNIALNLNSEDLDTSNLSPAQNEVVAETEKIRSPRVLRTPSEMTKRRGVRKLKLGGLTADQKLPSEEKSVLETQKGYDVQNKLNSTRKYATPEKEKSSGVPRGSPRLKQTTLKFHSPHKNESSKSQNDISNDEPGSSKRMGVLLARNPNSTTQTLRNVDETDNPSTVIPNIYLDCNNSDQSSIFDLRLDSTPEKNSSQVLRSLNPISSKTPPISPSCVLLPSNSPDIVLLDDSGDESTNRQIVFTTHKFGRGHAHHTNAEKTTDENRLFKEPPTRTSRNRVDQPQIGLQYDPKQQIKMEQHSEESFFNQTDSFGDDVLLSIKEEILSDKSSPTKLNIKERFNIDCADCQKYIDFVGGELSDKEIEEHLRKCSRHKERDVFRTNTPEGFWNPLLQSFAEDDPRNEVLVDTRFANKRHHIN